MSGDQETQLDLAQLVHFGVPQFDSLNWARDEITDALVCAHAALAHVPPSLAEAELCLRQSARALAVIGLEAEAHVLDAAARMVGAMEAGECELSEYSITWAHQAIDAMTAALEARAAGKPILALAWLPLYRQLCAARGETVRASDLFYPDLNRRPQPLKAQPASLPDHLLAQQALFEHRCFERGMRTWLREPAAGRGVADMRRAAHAIERGQRLPAARAFWWAVGALFASLLDGAQTITPELKQLVQSIERQLRHLLAGAMRVPDDLMREVLYHVAISTSAGAQVVAVKQAYELQALLPVAQPQPAVIVARPVWLDEAAAALARIASGEVAACAVCTDAVRNLLDEARTSQSLELPRLLGQCAHATDWLARLAGEANGEVVPLVQEMEAALGVLARGFADPGQNDAELQRQTDLLAARLAELEFSQIKAAPGLTADAGTALESLQKEVDAQAAFSRADWLQVAARAFEELESGLQASLQHPAQTEALEALSAPLSQLDEALSRLGAESARAQLAPCAGAVRTLIDMGQEAQDAVFPELVAYLSQLGEALAQLTLDHEAAQAAIAGVPQIVLAGGFVQAGARAHEEPNLPLEPWALAAIEYGVEAASEALALPTAPPAAAAVEQAPAPLTCAQFVAQAEALMAQILAGLKAWQAAPDEMGHATALANPVRQIKRGAGAVQAVDVAERAQGALVMLQAAPPSLAACDVAIRELGRALHALAATLPVDLPPLPQMPEPAPLEGHGAQLSRSIEDATEMAIASVQMEGEIHRMQESLAELQQRAQAMSAQVQALLEITPPEADSRAHEALAMLAEGAQDLFALQLGLARRAGRAESLMASHGSRQRDLHQTLLDLRNQPVGLMRERLEASLARLGHALGLPSRLTFIGGEIALPPTLIEGLAGVLENLLPHIARPLAEAGVAAIEIDLEITAQGHALGIAIGPVRAHTLIDLAALRARCAALPINGAPEVERVPRAGNGDTLRISLPAPSVAIPAVLLAGERSRTAVPQHLIVHRQILEGPLLAQLQEAGQFSWQGETYPLRDVSELLGQATPPLRRAQALLLRAGGLRLALLCEPGVIERELVLKKTTPALSRVPGVIGATVLDDNEPVLLIDPITLAECKSKPKPAEGADQAELHMRPLRLLLVDDSPSARKLGRNVLEAAGFEVVTASGGGHALDCLRDVGFSAVLIDSDMPGMDGLELVRRLRSDRSLIGLPVIMLSVRRVSGYREAALKAGVDHYLAKPYQPAELVSLLEATLAGAGSAAVVEAVLKGGEVAR